MIKTLAFAAFVIFFCAKIVQWLKNRRFINKIPGPPGYPIIGNVLEFRDTLEGNWNYLRRLSATYYPIYKFWAFYVPVVHIVCPQDIEIILSTMKHSAKSTIYDFLTPWLGTGLLISKGSKWQSRRKMLTPAFHFNILQQFLLVFAEESERLVRRIDEECDKQFTNIVPIIAEFTLNTICETAMGTRLDRTDKNVQKYIKALSRIDELFVERMKSPWYYSDLAYSMSPERREQKRLINDTLHAFSKSLIADRELNFKESKVSKVLNNEELATKTRLAMLDLLILAKRSGQSIDDEGIREEVDTFMFEGHDTTAACICFTLLLLACHQDIQEKVVQEQYELFGDSDCPPTLMELQNLRYLDQVIKESLRMYPSVATISRETDETIRTHTGYTIPAQTVIQIHIYDVHHNPELYPEPHKFDPDRFLPENAAQRHPYAYIPFSAGPRNCIGQRFAIQEVKVVLSAILRKFVLEQVDTPSTITQEAGMVLKTTEGIKVRFRRRPPLTRSL